MEATKINEVMNKLDDLPYQRILFDGTWGIGKTKHTIDSIKDKENFYYISLFGKRNIDAFYQELYYLLLSKHEVKFKKVLNNMKNINFSQFGFNISIPLISDIFIDIQKQLKIKSNITIIIDDLERKNDDFNIKEVFGFIDSITKNEGIKVILVASSDNFSIQEKNIFEEYAEKSINRIYKITTYSKDAPQKIMGDNVWSIIKEIHQDNELKNLRTLEKTNLFIEEVIHEIPDDVFNTKFNKEDIYKICFSVVLFVVDHKCEMLLLPKEDGETNNMFFDTYNSEENFSDYIWHHILKRNLNNSMMHNLIPVILKWFLTGDYSKAHFKEIVKQVDTYVESTIPLFMSDEQIIKEVNHFSIFIKDLDHDISIKNFLQRLDELASITEKTNLDFKYSVDEVVDWMNKNNDFSINYDEIHFDNFVRRESVFINEVILKLQTITKSNYRNHLLSVMAENTGKKIFTDTDMETVNEFKILFYNLKNDNSIDEENVIIKMKNNKWFLPLPLGEITHSHWSYCHQIFKCIAEIGYREENTIIRDASEYFNEEIDNHPDEIFKYRLRHLIKQYLKVV